MIEATQVESLLDEALPKSPPERAAFLAHACEGNQELRHEVERLLAVHPHAESFLGRPALHATAAFGPPREVLETVIGTVIGPYRLLEQIGEGGMGTVWMAQQTEPLKRLVAVKLIKAGMDSKQVIARFEAERQALALMDHPNIARVLDAGTTSTGRPYFIMDLVKGVPITRYCDEHHLTPRQRLELFLPVCEAVQHAHQKGIIHRDLKPSNVLVALYDGKPVPKVIDFGVAKAAGQSLTEKTLVTSFGNIVGTLEYMSPEQAEINQLDIDTRSDIYSLGVLLYELLAGSPPFSRRELEKAGMLEMLRVIREDEPSRPSTKLSTADGLPTLAANRGTEPAKLTKLMRGELDWMVMKALEKERSRRYETANGFAQDVQRYLADEPVQACPPSVGYRLRKFAQRNRGPVLAALTLLVLLLAVLGLALVGNYQVNNALADRNEAFTKLEGEQEKTAAALHRETDALSKQTEALGAKTKALEDLGKAQQETETANATLKEALEREQQTVYHHRIALAHGEWLAGNPLRSHQLLLECPEKYRHWEWHFLHRLHHTELRTLRDPGGSVQDLTYSPDGRLLASVGGMASVREAGTGRLLFTLNGHKGVNRVVFSPDSSRLATTGLDGTVRVWDATTGRQIVSIERPAGTLSWGLAFSPDGRQVACDEGGPNAAAAKMWDAATGEERFHWQAPEPPPGKAPNAFKGAVLSPDGKHLAVFGYYSLWLVEVQTKKAVRLAIGSAAPSSGLIRVAFSRDGSRLAATGNGGQVLVWQVPTGNLQRTMHLAVDRTYGLGFSPDGRFLAAGGSDGTVRMLNVADGSELMTLRGHAGLASTALFSPDGRQIVSAGHDATIRFWDNTAPPEGPRILDRAIAGYRRIRFSDDSQRLTEISHRIVTWEVDTGRNLFSHVYRASPNATDLSQDGRYFAGTRGYELYGFERATGRELFAEPVDKVAVASHLAFSPDGRLLAEGSQSGGRVTVRDARTGRLLQSLQGHRSDVFNVQVAFSPDGSRLASGCWGPNVKIWDTASWQELFSLDGPSAYVMCLAFSQDNRYLASGSYDKTICVWDVATGTKLSHLSGQADPVTCVTFSPDGKRLFSCGTEGSINVWDLTNRVKLLTLHQRSRFVAISPDGRRLASCSNDPDGYQVWESEQLGQAERWRRHRERVPFWQPLPAIRAEPGSAKSP